MSLSGCPAFAPLDQKVTSGEAVWVRVTDLAGRVFGPTASPPTGLRENISQGCINNCWVVSALATIEATHPELARTIVSHDAATGECRVRVSKHGVFETVTVDDCLLCSASDRTPYYVNAPDAWWMALAEKAYAKLHGGYAHLNAGIEADALVDFTGFTAEVMEISSAGGWDKFAARWDAGVLMGLSHFGEQAEAPTSGQQTSELIKATVSVPSGGNAELAFRISDDPLKVAAAFAKQHSLKPCSEASVVKFIETHQRGAREHIRKSETAEVHAARPEVTDEIVKSHSYAIIGLDPDTKAVCVWNAWGTGRLRAAESRPGDVRGSFWLAYDDLATHFNALHACRPSELTRIDPITLGEDVHVPITCDGEYTFSVMAPEARATSGTNDFAALGFSLTGLTKSGEVVRAFSPLAPLRQTSVLRTLQPGTYAVSLTHARDGARYTLLTHALAQGA